MDSDLIVGVGLSPLKGGFTPQRSSDISIIPNWSLVLFMNPHPPMVDGCTYGA
jgi:hypothetical protein